LCEVRVGASLTGNTDVHVRQMAKLEKTSVMTKERFNMERPAVKETGLVWSLYNLSWPGNMRPTQNALYSYITYIIVLAIDSHPL